ncbi:MAG: PKD domain-containing protein [Bacteroidota bacterium]
MKIITLTKWRTLASLPLLLLALSSFAQNNPIPYIHMGGFTAPLGTHPMSYNKLNLSDPTQTGGGFNYSDTDSYVGGYMRTGVDFNDLASNSRNRAYRLQTKPYLGRFTPSFPPRGNRMTFKGPNIFQHNDSLVETTQAHQYPSYWVTPKGYTRLVRFSIRVPREYYNDLQNWPAYNAGMDNVVTIQVFQNRLGYNVSGIQAANGDVGTFDAITGKPGMGNIPIQMKLRGDEFFFINEFSNKMYVSPNTEEEGLSRKWKGVYVDDVPANGEWMDILLYMRPSDGADGRCAIYYRKEGDSKFTLVDDYQGPWGNNVNPKYLGTPELPQSAAIAAGQESFGLYGSVRLTAAQAPKWLSRGIRKIAVDHSEMESHQCPNSGPDYISLEDFVSDAEQYWRSSNSPAPTPNQRPVASFSHTSSSSTAPATVEFNASSSEDPDGSIASYSWDFGDGSTGSGRTTDHSYALAGTYTVSLTVKDNDGASRSTTKNITLDEEVPPPPAPSNVPCTLPNDMLSQDIGSIAVEGSSCENNGVYTINAYGGDIWGQRDEFRYTYMTMEGDGEIIVRVTGFDNTVSSGKVGVMMRERLTAGSKHVHLKINSSKRVKNVQYRTSNGGNTLNGVKYEKNLDYPAWMKLVRTGNIFTSYFSEDGNDWDLVQELNINMLPNFYVGITTSNFGQEGGSIATFDNLTITDLPDPIVDIEPDFVEFEYVRGVARPHMLRNMIRWRTNNEKNTSHFIVERSTDGVLYYDMALIPRKRNTNNNYVAPDYTPLNGKLYYRIKAVSEDNQTITSNVITVTYSGLEAEQVKVVPNPITTGNDTRLQLNLPGATWIDATIIDGEGKAISTRRYNLDANGSLDEWLYVSNLRPGVYSVLLSNKKFLRHSFSRIFVITR